MAHYHSRGQLHMADTRDEAVEQAAQNWAALTETLDPSEVALISDASNQEIHRLNARAQHFRAERGELGELEVPVPGVHYGIRQGDRVATDRPAPRARRRADRERQPRRSPRHHPRRRGADRVRRDRSQANTRGRRSRLASASATRSTSTARKARPSPAPSSSPAAGRPARSPPTSRRPAPARAPPGSSPARISASKGTTPTASSASPRTCAAATRKRHRSRTPSSRPRLRARTFTARSRPAAPAGYRGSSARSTASSTHQHRSEHDEPTNTDRPTRPRSPAATRARRRGRHATLHARRTDRLGNGVALAAKDGKVRPLRPAPVLVGGNGSERAPWLEPYGGDAEWRQQMWGAIVALHGRYPDPARSAQRQMVERRLADRDTVRARRMASRTRRHTARTPATSSPSRTSSPTTPKLLRQQGGGVTKAWKPGAPPPEWAAK